MDLAWPFHYSWFWWSVFFTLLYGFHSFCWSRASTRECWKACSQNQFSAVSCPCSGCWKGELSHGQRSWQNRLTCSSGIRSSARCSFFLNCFWEFSFFPFCLRAILYWCLKAILKDGFCQLKAFWIWFFTLSESLIWLMNSAAIRLLHLGSSIELGR